MATNGGSPFGANLPGLHPLKAALLVGGLLDADGTPLEQLRTSYGIVPTGGLFDHHDLRTGERILRRTGLVEERDGCLYRAGHGLAALIHLDSAEAITALLGLWLSRDSPLWLSAAVGSGELEEYLVPDTDQALLEELIPDPEQREAFLLAHGETFDSELRSALGELGELRVVEAYRSSLADAGRGDLQEQVVRLSELDDRLGYDVRGPIISGGHNRIEVKTSASRGSAVRFFLSRNEARVGLRDENWSLVVCRPVSEEDTEVVGHCRAATLEAFLPRDKHDAGKWASAEIVLDVGLLEPGVPPCQLSRRA
jgi:hypothetical protein